MKTWIITGGAGCGKSAFTRSLKKMGGDAIESFSCDEAAGLLWQEPTVLSQIENELSVEGGTEAAAAKLDRKAVRELVFRSRDARQRLEAIMHPLILDALEQARGMAQKAGMAKVFLAEVPLYYEIQQSIPADTVIVVAASRTVQRTRLIEHRKLDATTCEGLLNAQLPLEEKTKKADVVVWNDGSLAALEAQASTLLRARWESLSI